MRRSSERRGCVLSQALSIIGTSLFVIISVVFMVGFKNPYLNDRDDYLDLWKQSVKDPETFWKRQAEMIPWISPYSTVWQPSSNANDQFGGTWFPGGKLNVSQICVDRWAVKHPTTPALLWIGEDDTAEKPHRQYLTYRELSLQVQQAANLLKKCGVAKGDRVAIWLPMVPEAIISQLACVRIGAIPVVIFSGFSAANAQERISFAGCSVIITADGGRRKGSVFSLRSTLSDEFIKEKFIKKIIVVNATNEPYDRCDKDVSWHEMLPSMEQTCPPEPMDANDPLFILYTSGTTGKPKGIVHSTAGFLIYGMTTMKYVWGVQGLLHSAEGQEREVWFCTADIGWITGHTYVTYAPLALGTTVVIYEGALTCPEPSRLFDLVDRYHITHVYTSPTLIRQLAAFGSGLSSPFSLSSLRVLGSVGEPIQPHTWQWYHDNVGKGRCPIVDTYWQTETGGYLCSPIAGVTPLKPGSCGTPCLGIDVAVRSEDGNEVEPGKRGWLCIRSPWPGMMRTIFNDHQRFVSSYLEKFPGNYVTGDEAYQDEDGHYWITGRMDDVIKVCGHRFGSAELEKCISSFPGIVESAVTAVPHEMTGEGIVVFAVTQGAPDADALKNHVRRTYGAIAVPHMVYFVSDLPKTRSGKIIRRMLKDALARKPFGDTSTLVNPECVAEIERVVAAPPSNPRP